MKTKAIELPTIETYGNYASGNYGAHALRVTVGGLTVYFSYKTPVAFHGRHGLVCRENSWGTTTGKHLNAIEPDKKRRVKSEEFERLFKAELAGAGCAGSWTRTGGVRRAEAMR